VRSLTPKLKLIPKMARQKNGDEKPIPGRFIGKLVERAYTPRILRGSIELPIERTLRARAEAKRERKRKRRLAGQ
jgi:hypothetical protein